LVPPGGRVTGVLSVPELPDFFVLSVVVVFFVPIASSIGLLR
jgi:hypothetical protein